MKEEHEIFVEGKETAIGTLMLNTGTLLLTDGVWVDNIRVAQNEKVAIDLGADRIQVPIIGTKQHGRRFLLIPIDAAEQKNIPDTKVNVTDPAEETPTGEDND